VSEFSVHPEPRAGDPFAHAGFGRRPSPGSCLDGRVHVGYEVDGPEGIEEHYVSYPCRRCEKELKA